MLYKSHRVPAGLVHDNTHFAIDTNSLEVLARIIYKWKLKNDNDYLMVNLNNIIEKGCITDFTPHGIDNES